NGMNWQVGQWSYLVRQEGSVAVMGSATDVLWFDPDGAGGFLPRFSARQTLQLDLAAGVYRLYELDGGVTTYSAATGALLSHADAAGNSVAVVGYTANGFNFAEVQRSYSAGGSTTVESFLYGYVDATLPFPQLSSVTLRRQVDGGAWLNVGRALYAYYGE